MTMVEKIFSRRDEEISFCWSPFPDGNDVINEVEVPFHDETRRYRYRADKYNGGIAFANIY